jgi:uncharacterized protein with FMN-binding domain
MHRRTITRLVALATAVTPLAALPAGAAAATTKTVKGPGVTMRWGTVRVTLKVTGRKIVGLGVSYPTERQRSVFINQQAVPLLKAEVLRAQSARINLVGGATLTSEAFDQSLQAALHAAHL